MGKKVTDVENVTENANVYTELFVRLVGNRTIGKAAPRSFAVTATVPVLRDSKIDELILRTAVRTVPQIESVELFADENEILLSLSKVNDKQTEWEFVDASDENHKISVNADPKRWYRASVRGIIAAARILVPAAKGGGGRSATPLEPEVEAYIENLDPATKKAIAAHIRRQAAAGAKAAKLEVVDPNAMPSIDARRATSEKS